MPYAGELFYRDTGSGDPPIVVLHGGWGYGFYPFDDAMCSISRRFVIPDRSGYGRSPARDTLPRGFHGMYADETLGLLKSIGIERCILWGHSDGAIIATLCALREPRRFAGAVLEALHLEREKPRSREFFTRMARDPDAFGERVTSRLAADLGDSWRTIIRADGQAWLDIAEHASDPAHDLFENRLGELAVPTLVLNGSDDPRTEPGELDRLGREVPHAEVHILPGAQHAPHSERAYAATCTRLVARFIAQLDDSRAT